MGNMVAGVKECPAPHRAQMVILMRPLFILARWFGVFPLEMDLNDPDRALYQDKLSFNYFRAVAILCLTTLYVTFHIASLAVSIWTGLSVLELIGQSMWLQASILSYLVSINLILCPQAMIKLYTKDWKAVETDCGGVFSTPSVRRFTRNLFLLYGAMGVASALLVGLQSVQLPTYPAFVLHYFYRWSGKNVTIEKSIDGKPRDWAADAPNFSTTTLVIHTICQILFVLWKWIGSAMLDVSLCLYGNVIGATMGSTLNQVNSVVENCTGGASAGDAQVFCQDSTGDPEICSKAAAEESIVAVINDESLVNGLKKMSHHQRMTPQEIYSAKMMTLLNDFQRLAQLVDDVNKATGALLLIEFAQLILMICALVFLPIKYSQHFDWSSTLLYAGNALAFLTRLVMLTICLGDVYPAGIEVNLRIAKFMISQPEKLKPELFNSIMGHLSVFSANPIAFNAWGFFQVTRGTLLGTLSVISTYIVVLLQVK